MEPVTIMLWLAEGAVAYVGGQVMSNITGNPVLSGIEGIAGIIRNAINEINTYTHQAIDENELRKLIASLDAIVNNLKAYSLLADKRGQIANKFLLEDAVIKTSDSISQCKTLGIIAVICFVNSVSLHIIARFALCKLTETNSGARLVQNVISEAKEHIKGIIPPFLSSLEPGRRLSVPNPPCIWQFGDGGQDYGKCWLNLDGVKTEVYDGVGPLEDWEYQGIINEKTKYFEDIRSNAKNSIISPVESAMTKWDRANQGLVSFINAFQ